MSEVLDIKNIKKLLVSPVAKPRMTRSDKWNQRDCVMRYREFADKLRAEAKEHDFELSDSYRVVFFIPMPNSWSNKKKTQMLHRPHQQKPDIDNLIKSFQDALTDDDSNVFHVDAEKIWNDTGFIMVCNAEIESRITK